MPESFDDLYARAEAAGVPASLLDAVTDAIASGKTTTEAASKMLQSQLDTYESPRGAFVNGDIVCVHGLNGRADLNGQHCVLTAFHDDAGRWAVRFVSGEAVRIKAVNLKHDPTNLSQETLSQLASGGPSAAASQRSENAATSQRSDKVARKAKGKRGAKEAEAPDTLDWRMHHLDLDQAEKGVEHCLSTLAALRSKPAEPRWLIFARRSKCWMGNGAQKRRMWFITIARAPNVAHCFVTDGPMLREMQGDATRIPSNGIVLGCLASLMVELGTRPATVAVPPLGVPCFRPRCAHELGQALAVVLHGLPLDVEQVPCGEVPEERPSSVLGLALGREHQRGPQPAWLAFMGLIQEQLEAMEESISERNGKGLSRHLGGLHESDRHSHLPGHDVNATCSIAALRDLFAASAAFHEAAPWEVLANEQYVHLKDDASGEEAWAMVCGHTDYAGRGLNLYGSKRDLVKAFTGGPAIRCQDWMDRLQYVEADMASFSVLDDIANLGLPLAANDPNREVVPCWYRRKQPEKPTSLEAMAAIWGNPPPHERWPFVASVARAIARFARDPMLCTRPPGFAPIEIVTTPVKLEGLTVTGGVQGRRGSRMAPAAELASMSIGAADKCNFCNKPAALAATASPAGDLLLKCRRCGIRYCSERCRVTDQPRHQAACGDFDLA